MDDSTGIKANRTIRVIAPATLEEDFTFDVLLDGRPFTVRVPPGGVKEGQEFEIPYPIGGHISEDEEESQGKDGDVTEPAQSGSGEEGEDNIDSEREEGRSAPIGRWRYHLLACCDVFTQATFWMACFCTPVMIAQLLTRMKLSWRGRPAVSPEEASLSFNRIVLTYVGVLFIAALFPVVGLVIAVGLYTLITVVGIGRNIRSFLRSKYQIPTCHPSVPGALEDGLCMCCCSCCSVIQMARHTHDDKEYPGHCCTVTGLELSAPKIV